MAISAVVARLSTVPAHEVVFAVMMIVIKTNWMWFTLISWLPHSENLANLR